jgi:nitrogen regulatory protein PII
MARAKRKRVEIVVEAPHLRTVLAWLREAGAPGWTVVPQVSGVGRQGAREGGDVAGVFHNALVIVIAGEQVAYRLLDESVATLKDIAAIVSVSDVEVARGEHF